MPIVDATHGPQIAAARLHTLAEALPHAVSLAVESPEEPYDGMLQPGDVEVRFRPVLTTPDHPAAKKRPALPSPVG